MLTVVLLALAMPVAAAGELRLLMFDAPDCEFCARFEQEVGGVYDRTEAGRQAPLERRRLADGPPPGLALAGTVSYTPTFVLVGEGRELGRITGYPGDAFFWALLDEMLRTHR